MHTQPTASEVDLLAQAHPRSPMRRPDWRWRAATYFAEVGRSPTRPWTDAWILAASRVDQGGSAGPQVSWRDRAVAASLTIRKNSDQPLIAELEARVLAGSDDAAIARRFGWRRGDVDAYVRLFYDVRSRLQTPSYILHFAGGACFDLAVDAPIHALWRPFAYAGGLYALEALLDIGSESSKPGTPSELAEFFAGNAKFTAIRKLALAARRLPSSAPPQVVLREALRVLRELRALAAPITAPTPGPELDSSFDLVVAPAQQTAASA